MLFPILSVLCGGPATFADELPSTPDLAPAYECPDGSADEGASPGEETRRSFLGALSFQFDNDVFALKDNRYTAGMSFAWSSAEATTYGKRSLQRKIVRALSFLPTVGSPGHRSYLQFAVGWEMYTPTDITVPDPPPGEHPYAGVLFLDSSVFSRTRVSNHQFTLRLGLVGPASGAEQVQKWFHRIIGSDIPQGWDTQLKNEPIINLFYQYGRRLLREAEPDAIGFDLTVNGGGGLGNFYIGGNVGAMARVGYRLPNNYGFTPMLGGAEAVVGCMPVRRGFFAYAFIAPQGFGVLRWLPTDGNTFTDSRSGDRPNWFVSLSLGLAVGYGRVVLTYRYNGIDGLTDIKGIRDDTRNDFGTILITVFLG